MTTPELRRRLDRVAQAQRDQEERRAPQVASRPRTPEEFAEIVECLIEVGVMPTLPPDCHSTHKADALCDQCRGWQQGVEAWARTEIQGQRAELTIDFLTMAEAFNWPISDATRALLEHSPRVFIDLTMLETTPSPLN